jgi:hypothetical protein
MPVAQHQSGVRAQKVKFQVGKIKRAHSPAIRITFFVTRENGIPATGCAVASGKSEIRGMPVAGEKCVNVAAIPGFLLSFEDRLNGSGMSLKDRLSIGGFVSGRGASR